MTVKPGDNGYLEDLLRRSRTALIEYLERKLNGEVLDAEGKPLPITAPELAVLRNILRDNGMVIGGGTPPGAEPGAGHRAGLPSFDKPDYED